MASLQWTDFQEAIGQFLGWGRSGWDVTKTSQIDEVMQAGYRRFVTPPILPGEKDIHEWSFLSPTSTLDTVADDWDYDMDPDFSALLGGMTYEDMPGVAPIPVVSETMIRTQRDHLDLTSKPTLVAVRPKHFGETIGQRFELIFYPTPDGAYTISYRYSVLATSLSEAGPYPLGGQDHCDTVLALMLAEADKTFNDNIGMHESTAIERLAASVSRDRKAMAPTHLGYNGDPSNYRHGGAYVDHRAGSYSEYEGMLYGDFAP